MFHFSSPPINLSGPTPRPETASESGVPDSNRSTTDNTVPESTISSVPPQGAGGARPKYSSPLSKPNTATTSNTNTNNSNTGMIIFYIIVSHCFVGLIL